MSNLRDLHLKQGAVLAPDGIPLHYGDLRAEDHAAQHTAVLLDRSHEGRIRVGGRDAFALMQRMSTNDVEGMAAGEGRPTLFTTPNGRILERVTVYRHEDHALVLTEPTRGDPFRAYLQKNIFFNDLVTLEDMTPLTGQFALHGPAADAVLESLLPGTANLPAMHSTDAVLAGVSASIARNKPISGAHWTLVVPQDHAAEVYAALLAAGTPHGLRPAGGLAYNLLCVRAGRPMLGRELSSDFIPLEIGLWDEVSFSKGCYTGQEIIARMESRGKLAKTLVRLHLTAAADAGQELLHAGKRAGRLTSSVTTPDGEHLALGVVKPHLAQPQQQLTVGMGAVSAIVLAPAGNQPAHLLTEETI